MGKKAQLCKERKKKKAAGSRVTRSPPVFSPSFQTLVHALAKPHPHASFLYCEGAGAITTDKKKKKEKMTRNQKREGYGEHDPIVEGNKDEGEEGMLGIRAIGNEGGREEEPLRKSR